MTIKKFIYNDFQENTFVISDDHNNCIIIDPGCYYPEEYNELSLYISQNELAPIALLNTHCHIDHVLGNAWVMRKYKIPFYMHEADLATLNAVPNYAPMYGFVGFEASPQPTHLVSHGDILEFGNLKFEVLFTPGHAPGHVVYYCDSQKLVINGDVLFKGSFGRFDLPNGDLQTLKKSITEIIFQLPEDTVIYCGHGPETNVGTEKNTNPIWQY
jgi:hydroxyacylglutathione hydrolase